MSWNDECKSAIFAYVAHNPGKTIYSVKEYFRTREEGTNYWNLCGTQVVLLEGYAGGFSCDCLQKVRD